MAVGGRDSSGSSGSVSGGEAAGKLLAAVTAAAEARDADAARSAAARLAKATLRSAEIRDALGSTKARAVQLVAVLKHAAGDDCGAEDLVQAVAAVAGHSRRAARRLAKAGVAGALSRLLGRHAIRGDAAVAVAVDALLSVAPHDRRLGTALRLGGGLGVLLTFLKQKKADASALPAPLRLLSAAVKNSKLAAQQAAAGGAMPLLLAVAKTHSTIRRGAPVAAPAFRSLAHIVAAQAANTAQLQARGGVRVALQAFCGWAAQPAAIDTPAAEELRAAALALLKAATAGAGGREALLKVGGVGQLLAEARRLATPAQEKNALLTATVVVLKRFLPKVKVPAPTNLRLFAVPAAVGPRLLPLAAMTDSAEGDDADWSGGSDAEAELTETETEPEAKCVAEESAATTPQFAPEDWPALSSSPSTATAASAASAAAAACGVTTALRWLEDEWDPAQAEDALSLNDAETQAAARLVAELADDDQPVDGDADPEDAQARLAFEPVSHSPSYTDHEPPAVPESLHTVAPQQQRELLLDDLAALDEGGELKIVRKPELIYDVNEPRTALQAASKGISPLFESRFESGNLRQAYRTHESSFQLILSSDINAQGHHQWFYFRLTGVTPQQLYKFDFVNLQKPGSQFQHGMQPVVFSRALGGWRRMGSRMAYYKSTAGRATKGKSSSGPKSYYTLSFSIAFPADDTYYVAYHFPFTYSDLQLQLRGLRYAAHGQQRLQSETLCRTLAGNRCDLLTITSWDKDDLCDAPLARRPYIVLTARVHPGETNSSWMMKGLLDFLLSDAPEAAALRKRYVFKIVPMLNPDGVAHGSHRCSLAGVDLNRHWDAPDAVQHPTIYYTKLLLRKLRGSSHLPLLYCDFHGHSRKKNVFLYGCREAGQVGPEQALVDALERCAPLFSAADSRFGVEKAKLSTSRVVVWSMGVTCAYTMEATYNSASSGLYAGQQVGTVQLEEMGRCFASALPDFERSLRLYSDESMTALTTPRHSFCITKLPRSQAVDDDDDDEDDDEDEADGPRVRGRLPKIEVFVPGGAEARTVQPRGYAAAAACGIDQDGDQEEREGEGEGDDQEGEGDDQAGDQEEEDGEENSGEDTGHDYQSEDSGGESSDA